MDGSVSTEGNEDVEAIENDVEPEIIETEEPDEGNDEEINANEVNEEGDDE